MEITRSGILMDCLEEVNRELHKYSKHGNGLLPLEGYEKHFDDLNEKCAMLRAMILEAESREAEVKTDEPRASREVPPLAQWQRDIMNCTVTDKTPGLTDLVWNPIEQKWMPAGIKTDQMPGPLDEGYNPLMTPDEALLRRRYRQAEGFKPAPVVYPGGEDDGTV